MGWFFAPSAYGSLIGLRAVPSASSGDGGLGFIVLIADGGRMTPWSGVWGRLLMLCWCSGPDDGGGFGEVGDCGCLWDLRSCDLVRL